MTKKELRQLYRTKRAGISGRDRLRNDDLLLLQFQQLDYSSIQTVLSYWPMAHAAEPNTLLFSGYLRHMLPQLELAYPKTDLPSQTMEAYVIDEDTAYHTNEWGITEPKNGIHLNPETIDLVFVPMLICDKSGHRVGYGKGFYDRFLARCRREVLKIGFSYFEPVAQITDPADFDIPLTHCITPSAIYEF